MNLKRKFSKKQAIMISYAIVLILSILIAFFHILFKVEFKNYYSMIITGFILGLAFSLSTRYFYKRPTNQTK